MSNVDSTIVGQMTPMLSANDDGGSMTYPLYGQNVLDWRTPAKEHNNMPPSYNVKVLVGGSSSGVPHYNVSWDDVQ